MRHWLLDLPMSVRVVSYFGAREEVMFRLADVMQMEQAHYLACHEGLVDWEGLYKGLGISHVSELDGAQYLVLDECDRLDPRMLACLVRVLLRETRRIKLVLFGRRPLIDLYGDENIAPFYHCYLHDRLIESPYRERDEDNRLVLYVEAFGQGRAFANGQLIQNWTGPQQIENFFVMLDLMPAAIDTLLIALYGSANDDTYGRFHVSKTYINRVLRRDFTTLGWGAQARQQAYYLSSDIDLYSDVHEFGRHITVMFDPTSTPEAILTAAVGLIQFPYRDYVGQISSNKHLNERRLQIRYYLSQALAHVGYHVWREGDVVQAETLFARATILDRTNREPVDALMALYQQQGDTQASAAVYRRWKDAQQQAAV